MERIVEGFLSLLCDMSGARSVHLLVWYAREGERLILLDRAHRAIPGMEPRPSPGSQIPFALTFPALHREDAPAGYRSHLDDRHASRPQTEYQRWPESVFGERGCPRWHLEHQFGTQDWLFERMLHGLRIELRLEFSGSNEGHLYRQLHAALAFLHLLETLLLRIGLPLSRPPDPMDERRTVFEPPLVGISSAMLGLRRQIIAAAGAMIPVLIEGESGTGKEIVARNLHRLSDRWTRPLVIVNCMELPETLLQTELFGHLKGAFTGASKDRMGLVESANGGSLFLDEIGEMPLAQQAALLRVIQEREVRRIGDSQRRAVDVRFIFATNRDLADCVKEGRFREDLYFRINGVRLFIPPLRQRREDIPPLVKYFIERCTAQEESITGLTADALTHLLAYPWPGNVRELRNEIERIVVLNRDARRISPDMLSPRIREVAPRQGRRIAGETLPAAVGRLERRMIIDALRRLGGNRTRAAAVLGITRQGLLKKIKRYGIDISR